LYQRKPRLAPVIEPQNTVSSEGVGRCARVAGNSRARRGPAPRKSEWSSAPDAITIRPIARPSRPSVRFTAFDAPTTTKATKNEEGGRNASGYKNGVREERVKQQIRFPLLEKRHVHAGVCRGRVT